MFNLIINSGMLAFLIIYMIWKYSYSIRDPERKIPIGNHIVSPADGIIVYVKEIHANEKICSIKKGKDIQLEQDIRIKIRGKKLIIGIFMTPFDVHINRSPIKGKIELMKHYRHKSLPMTKMWFRTIFKIEPYYKGSIHILENERVITRIKGELTCYIIQIADIAVNKISNWVRIGDIVTKGQRIGIIKMGSQVDIVLPASRVLPLIKVGQKVKAGETILAKAKFERKKKLKILYPQ